MAGTTTQGETKLSNTVREHYGCGYLGHCCGSIRGMVLHANPVAPGLHLMRNENENENENDNIRRRLEIWQIRRIPRSQIRRSRQK